MLEPVADNAVSRELGNQMQPGNSAKLLAHAGVRPCLCLRVFIKIHCELVNIWRVQFILIHQLN